MSLVYPCCWAFGSHNTIWDSSGVSGGDNKVLDGDNGDDVDGETRWGFQVAPSGLSGVHPAGFRDPFVTAYTEDKVRIGMSFKLHTLGDDSNPPGVGQYVCIEEASGVENVGQNVDHWAWGVNVVSGASRQWSLYWWDDSASGWVWVANGGSFNLGAYYYVKLELDPSVKTDSAANLAEALDTTETGIDVDDGTKFSVKDIIVIDSEKMRVTAIASNTLTVIRDVYQTVAATHTNGTDIYFSTPTAALYVSDAGGETNVIAAQSEPATWEGHGYGCWQGGLRWLNEQESGKGAHNVLYSICNVQVTDAAGDVPTGRIAWADRHVIMAQGNDDVATSDSWTGTDNDDKWKNVNDYNREGGCGSVGDDIRSATVNDEQMFETVDVSGVLGCFIASRSSSTSIWSKYLTKITGTAKQELIPQLGGYMNSDDTGDMLYYWRLAKPAGGGGAWTDAKFNSLQAGVKQNSNGNTAIVEEYSLVCIGTALSRPSDSCAGVEPPAARRIFIT